MPVVSCVTSTEDLKRRRGRPRKDGTTKVTTHYLHLPPGISNEQFHGVSNFFEQYRFKSGDRILLYYTDDSGLEQSVEVPFRVYWNEGVRDALNTTLGGWA